ncbi:MAPEG family protein [Erythrobacter sp. Alg231-14]|uniref:MAPEG family protein n=1 Tax=Erythrobacter sp. Alg231-14 TaxID=1922225 RepID=UPI00307B61E4
MMTILPVTLAAAAAAAILNLWLSIRIGAIRQATEISIGHADSDPLERRMRAQSNFVENTPFVLALVLAIELTGKGSWWLAYVAGAYFIARIAHAYGMDGGKFKAGRMVGTLITMVVLLGLAIVAALIAGRVL